MGSQAEVKGLMKLRPFKESLEISAKILKEKHNYDLMTILNSSDPAIFENVTNSFLSIVSVQVGSNKSN
jgi:hypothetical protein